MRRFKIEYACVCSVGRLRRNNEDNFYCGGHIREDVDSVEDTELSGTLASDTNALFAVFDGMGGEACGEIASYEAAAGTAEFVSSREEDGSDGGEYLYELAQKLNERILAETEKRSLVIMGATAAILRISGEDVFILNAGDSRIYKLSRHELRQISQEHSSPYERNAITQFLGMPEGYGPQPYIAAGKFKAGDMFLLCSDGVTDMLGDGEIRAIIDGKRPLSELVRELVDAALEKGGIDNTTALLLRFTK